MDGVGIPIGNYVSQYDGNFNLSVVDHWLKEVNEKLKVEYLLEHLEQVQIFPDKVIVIVPILSEGIVVEKAQYVSREKWCRKINHYKEYCRTPSL